MSQTLGKQLEKCKFSSDWKSSHGLLRRGEVIFTWAINVSINDILATTNLLQQQHCCNCCNCRCCNMKRRHPNKIKKQLARQPGQEWKMLLKLAFYVYGNGRWTAGCENPCCSSDSPFPFPLRVRFRLSLITAIFHRIYAHALLTFWPSADTR